MYTEIVPDGVGREVGPATGTTDEGGGGTMVATPTTMTAPSSPVGPREDDTADR
jgi:hypothetical protein